jgi:PAS domain S-box-containing protein
MKNDLRILHLEDDRDDAAIIEALLCDEGIDCKIERVLTRNDFVAALERGGFDLILSDFSLPAFDGLSALTLASARRPEVPFLFVSGTLGEELAVDALQRGATDYVLKQRLVRLAPAVRRAVAQAEERLELMRAEEAMIQSEFKYRQLFECLGEAAILADASSGRVVDTNRQAEILFGRTRSEILGRHRHHLYSSPPIEEQRWTFTDPENPMARVSFEAEILSNTGCAVPVAVSISPILLHGRRLVLGLYRDISDRKQGEVEIRRLKDEMESRLRERTDELNIAMTKLEAHCRFVDSDLRPRIRAIGDSVGEILAPRNSQPDASNVPAMSAVRRGVEDIESLIERLSRLQGLDAERK